MIGMCLFRDLSMRELVATLDLALPGTRGVRVAPSSIVQARERLGEEPLRWLFERTAETWAHASARTHAWRGLAVYGADGTTVRVPDSSENRQHFGGQDGRWDSTSGYPLVRVVTLMALRSHVLAGARFGPYGTDERVYAAALWPLVPDRSVVLVDRLFLAAKTLLGIERGGTERHWVTRARSTSKWTRTKRLGAGDELVEMTVSSEARRQDPSLPQTWPMRAIRYRRRGFAPQTVLTSLVDAKRYPAAEIIALYHERWEIELGYNEVKRVMLAREETTRSKSPRGVAQELWGLALAYNLARPGVIEGEAGRRVIVRLALFGAAATPAYMALGKLSWGWWPLNVMALFLVAAVVLRLVVQGGTTRRAMAAIVFVVAGSVVEFWWFGLGTIGAAWRYCKAPTWQNAALLTAAVATLGLVNGNQWALAALPVAAVIARIKARIPRTGRFFYWFYPLHLSAILVLTIIPITFTS